MNSVKLIPCSLIILAAVIFSLPQFQIVATPAPAPATVNPVVIDFENLVTSGPGQSGQVLLFRQFADEGVTFNSPTVLDYSKGVAIPGFAHSGTKGIEQCYGKEFCTTPIEISFTAAQRHIKVWVGYSAPLGETRTVVLRAFDAGGVQVAEATTVLNPNSGPQPIRAPLEVTSETANIIRSRLSFSPGTTLMNALAVDDIEFDTAGPRPGCLSTRNPSIALDEPVNGHTAEINEIVLEGTIRTESLLEAATLTATGGGNARSIDLLSSGLIPQGGGTFGPVPIDGLLVPGSNTVTLAVSDCRGANQSSVAITFAPEEERWVSIGPFGIPLANNDVISGQVNAIAVHPADANTLYIGSSEGGVWKTSNGGGSWRPLTDFQLTRRVAPGVARGTLSVGSIALDQVKPDTIYVGTGDPNKAEGLVGDGLGVFRSNDAGVNWTPTGANLSASTCQNDAISQAVVNKIIVRRGSPTTLFAATNVGLFKYKEDGTDCWRRITNGLPSSGNAIDLVGDASRTTLYAAFSSQGIYKTTDSEGEQWRQLTSGLPTSTSGFGRIALAFGGGSATQQLLYAGFDPGATPNGRYRLFQTIDGENWRELSLPPSDGQLDFNNTLAVGPLDPNELYIGQIGLWRAADGGNTGDVNNYGRNPPVTNKSWTNLSCCLGDANPFRAGLDLHADIHDVVFARPGSFVSSPSQLQILYVASDGGVTKGVMNSSGIITWQTLTRGLAIGQCGTLGLSPSDPDEVSCGLWHNGTFTMISGLSDPVSIGGGDGFQAQIDASTPTTVYFNCNAAYGGALCRNSSAPHILSFGNPETIWGDNTVEAGGPWADPYRPGHFLRIQRGKLVRNQTSNTLGASALNVLSAWEVIDPPAKTGNTKTVAFGRRRAFDSPIVYYLGTDTGQIWRGSPESNWIKLCDCGGTVDGISVDLTLQDRIVAIFGSVSSPGRIRELETFPDGVWKIRNMDNDFRSELQVNNLFAIAIDPLDSSKVFVGTDQGVYRGQKGNGEWVWSRSQGVPNLNVRDIQVHQSFTFVGLTGVVRAGTFGRGVYELRRTARVALPLTVQSSTPSSLKVEAMQVGEDGAPPSLSVRIPVTRSTMITQQETPFELSAANNSMVSLEAPAEIHAANQVLRFVGWSVGGERGTQSRLRLALNKNTRVVAYYELKEHIRELKAGPLYVSVSATTRQLCMQGFSHELIVSWKVSGGQAPVTVLSEITMADGRVETVGLRPLGGSRNFPLNLHSGGIVKVKVIARDVGNSEATNLAVVQPKVCR